jgi:YtkA-like protein
MKTRVIIAFILITITAFIAVACSSRQPSGEEKVATSTASGSEKVIKSAKVSDLTVTLASATGEIKQGENELTLSFTDDSGKPIDVGTASLKFHMAAMGMMAEMNDVATVTRTGAPGKHSARVKVEAPGDWEAVVNYEGPRGMGQASLPVVAK